LLIELHRQLLRQDRCLVLLEPTDVVRRAIRLMRLDHFFLIASDAMEASELIRARAQQKRRVTALSAHATLPLIWQGEITAANSHDFWAGAETQIDSFADYREPITIDLSGVSFIDSTGVGLLLRVQRHAATKGAQVHFINPQPSVLNVLRIARLEQALLWPNGSTSHRFSDSTIPRFNAAWRERGFAWQHLSRARS